MQAAKQRARTEEPSEVKVHKADGNMEPDSVYRVGIRLGALLHFT